MQWIVVDRIPAHSLVFPIISGIVILFVFPFLFYTLFAISRKQQLEKRIEVFKNAPIRVAYVPVIPPVLENETTYMTNGSIFSSVPQEHRCEKCGWVGMPYDEGKVFTHCPGCSRKIRYDIVKCNDI